MRLGLMGHVHNHGHEDEAQRGGCGEKGSADDSFHQRENCHDADHRPCRAPEPSNNIKSGEFLRMIEIIRDVRFERDEPAQRRALEHGPDRINPQPAILVKLGVEVPLPRLHLRQRLERIPLIRLIRHEPISADDAGALGVVAIDDRDHIAIDRRRTGYVRGSEGIVGFPRQFSNLLSGPDRVRAKEEPIRIRTGKPPADA